jgi:NADPH:quinone reductase-like Zn-dependent oxidoreductase
MGRRARIHGSTLRTRPLEGKAAAARLVEAHVLPLFDAGRLSVPVDTTFALEDAPAAYEHFAARGKFGKIVLTMA